MATFVSATDVHLSARTPASRLDDYTQTILGKLNQLSSLAIKVKADAILLAGDIFNEKEPRSVPPYLIYQLLMWCRQVNQAGIRILAIPGNHDLYNDRYDSLPKQPIGLLFAFGAMEDVSFRSVVVAGVSISGIPYPAAKTLGSWHSLPHPDTKRAIILAHCFATPEGGEYFHEPMLRYSDLLDLPYNVFIFGHDHRDNGVVTLGGRYFINIGALSRGTLTHENINRDVKCALIGIPSDEEGEIRIRQLRLQYRPANEVFDLALRAQKERERDEIESFVGSLNQDLLNVGPVSFRERLEAMNVSQEVKQRVLYYIESAEAVT